MMEITSLRHSLREIAVLLGLALLAMGLAAPVTAHQEHKKQPDSELVAVPAGAPATAAAPVNGRSSGLGRMSELPNEDASPPRRSFGERLLDWLGRLHPLVVHFPIAFFPAALFTAVIGRKRPAFEAPVRFLVIAGGVIGPIAALLGWFDGGFDFRGDDMLLHWHRWIGTAIGVGSLGLGIWAWRRPDANRGVAMIFGLTLITAAIVVQGWFGGAMVHGIDHLNW